MSCNSCPTLTYKKCSVRNCVNHQGKFAGLSLWLILAPNMQALCHSTTQTNQSMIEMCSYVVNALCIDGKCKKLQDTSQIIRLTIEAVFVKTPRNP